MYYLNLFDIDMAEAARSLPFILAEATVKFKAPVHAAQRLRVFVRVSEFGTRSFRMEYRIENADTRQLVAEGSTVQVTYDYDRKMTIPVPEELKKRVLQFESTINPERSEGQDARRPDSSAASLPQHS